MLNAMHTAATGMSSQQRQIDTIANNLANVNTTAFKRSTLEFQDLIYQKLQEAGASLYRGVEVPVQLQVGHGTAIVASNRQFAQGDLVETSNPLDVVIEGDGFLQVRMPDGEVAYTRDGSLKLSADGTIVTSSGFRVEPEIVVPDDATSIVISADGVVQAFLHGEDLPVNLGELVLARFINPNGLAAQGRNLFRRTPASGDALLASPGTQGIGTLRQGFVESSNVEVVTEMVNMILAQRAYEISSKAIQTSDEMLQLANNLR